MKGKILKFVTTNPGYKLLALVLAFALWLAVYNSEDPSKTITFTTSVTVANAEYLTDQNECYEVMNNTGTVTFAVSAKRSILEKLDSSDFTASADFSRMNVSEDGKTATIPIDITPDRYASSIKINGRTKYLEISLENLVTKQFVIKAESEGTVKEGYALGTVTVENPNVLKVTGPEAVVNSIANVVAVIDVDGMEQTISDNVKPILYDAENLKINTSRLTLSNTEVSISAQILATKELKLQFSTTGEPAGENEVLGVESNPVSVLVKGTASTLSKLTTIDIPPEALNVEGAEDTVETVLKITDYLPEGVQLVDESQSEIEVMVLIQKNSTKNYNIPTSEIKIEGLGDNLTVSYNVSSVMVIVAGTDENLEELLNSMVKGTVDLTGLAAGKHYVNVTLNLDSSKYTYIMAQVQVIIEEKITLPDEATTEMEEE